MNINENCKNIEKSLKNRFRVVSGVPSAEVNGGSKQSFDPSQILAVPTI